MDSVGLCINKPVACWDIWPFSLNGELRPIIIVLSCFWCLPPSWRIICVVQKSCFEQKRLAGRFPAMRALPASSTHRPWRWSKKPCSKQPRPNCEIGGNLWTVGVVRNLPQNVHGGEGVWAVSDGLYNALVLDEGYCFAIVAWYTSNEMDIKPLWRMVSFRSCLHPKGVSVMYFQKHPTVPKRGPKHSPHRFGTSAGTEEFFESSRRQGLGFLRSFSWLSKVNLSRWFFQV